MLKTMSPVDRLLFLKRKYGCTKARSTPNTHGLITEAVNECVLPPVHYLEQVS